MPLRRLTTSEDLIGAIHLASPASEFVTGQTLLGTAHGLQLVE
jgi:hypothetical protein